MTNKPNVERRKISDLVPDPSNANSGTERGLSMLDDSLSVVGLGRSIVVDKNGVIIGGNKTTERAIDRGFENAIVVHTTGDELVVVQRDDLDLLDDDPNNAARKLAYYDNRVASVDLQWNAEQLLADVNAGFDFEHLFTDGELAALLAEVNPPAVGEDPTAGVDRAAELQLKWQTERGQLWQIGKHRLLCGDSTNAADVATLMAGERAAICFTSPPYNAGDSEKLSNNSHSVDTKYIGGDKDNRTHEDYLRLITGFTAEALKHCEYVVVNLQSLAGNKVAVIEYLYQYRTHLVDQAVWVKDNPPPAMAENVFTSAFEHIFVLSPENMPNRAIKTASFRGTVSNVYRSAINASNEYSDVHAATFPVEFAGWGLSSFTRANATVYDPFGGSGTTMVACEQLGRQCRMMELEPKYCAVILERMAGMGLTPELQA